MGGTFTDLFLVDTATGSVRVHKVPSTSANPAAGVLTGVREICKAEGINIEKLDQFVHGTTIATNIVLERNGAECGLITTEGFRDIIYIGRHKKKYTFSIMQDLPWQKHVLVPRRLRFPVKERVIPPKGDVLRPLDLQGAREAVRKLKQERVEAMVVCFLFSFLNPSHELQVREIIEQEYPGVYVSLSHEVAPMFREYERFSTTCLNAYVGPKVKQYVEALSSALKTNGLRSSLLLMQSNGGVATVSLAYDRPVNLLMSGPAAGLVGGVAVANAAGFPDIITLDVGGTSTDVGIAVGGRSRFKPLLDTKINEYQVMVPMIDIDTIGAGGGSIAYVDEGGMFRVGPKSAGANPGPACYGLGGEQPTATDAHLVLRRLNPSSFLGGHMRLCVDRAREAIKKHLCSKLNLGLEEAALGVIKIMNANICNTIESNSIRRGLDPRDFTLVAFGGAGPLHACAVAKQLAIPKILIPPFPGIHSALGLLSTNVVFDATQTVLLSGDALNNDRLRQHLSVLEEKVQAQLCSAGFCTDSSFLVRYADCRYEGQGYELRVELPGDPADPGLSGRLVQNFHELHFKEYRRRFDAQPVEVVNLLVLGVGKTPEFVWPRASSHESSAPFETRGVFFEQAGQLTELNTTCFRREDLGEGSTLPGPALVEQVDSTTLIPPGFSATLDGLGNLLVQET